MKIELDIDLFLNFATQTLGYCSMINYPEIVVELAAKDPEQKHCVLDGTDVYTTEQWIFEKKHRDTLNKFGEHLFTDEVIETKKQYSKGILGLAERLEEARATNNQEEINKIK